MSAKKKPSDKDRRASQPLFSGITPRRARRVSGTFILIMLIVTSLWQIAGDDIRDKFDGDTGSPSIIEGD